MGWYRDLYVRHKLMLFGGMVAVLAMAVGAAGLYGIRTSEAAMRDIIVQSTALRNHQDIDMMHDALRADVMTALNAGSHRGEGADEVRADLAEHIATMRTATERNHALTLSAEVRATMDSTQHHVDEYIVRTEHMVEAALKDPRSANAELPGYLGIFRELEEELGRLSDRIETENERSRSDGAEHASIAGATIWSVTGIVLALIVATSLMISKRMSTPVHRLIGLTGRVAAGDLTVEIVPESKDEIGNLSATFRDMVENLRKTLGAVQDAAAAVASASAQISSSTEEMASGAQAQTVQTSEVASAVEEMTKTIIENSQNAENTAQTAKQAKEAAANGGAAVTETVRGMQEIAAVVQASAATVKELGTSSDQIGRIIGMIDEIADQTNLLALNAAIEAARAGEHGRGFAVVADEVRKLAERTMRATKEVGVTIQQIQRDTISAVQTMERGTETVEIGIRRADRAGASLTEIVTVFQDVMERVSQIAVASTEQSTASEMISRNVEAISSVTQQTASGTQEIAKTAEDLNRLTENLQRLLSQFVLTTPKAERESVRPAAEFTPASYALMMN